MLNFLVLGSGGREHAFAWKLAQSSEINKLFIAPGNAGSKEVGTNVNLNINDFDEIKTFVLENDINTVVVGPEDPLVNGIYDFFKNDHQLSNINVVGPSKKGAELEGSKEFAKEFMFKHNIPTAAYKSFDSTSINEAYAFLETLKAPYVLKADGLAAGKGVVITETLEHAKSTLKEMLLDKKFGDASAKVVIEEFLDGIELSVFVLTDGESYKILPSAKDYKRIGEGDTGLNTGGMGAVSPVPFADKAFLDKVENNIIIPTIKGFKKDEIEYRGFVFIGLMNVNNDPYVIEYNVRMGDPETEVVLPLIKSDLVDIFEGLKNQTLSERDLEIDTRTACTIVSTSGGYPEAYEKGKVISGIGNVKESLIFHAGTKSENNEVLTNGGRVLTVTSFGKTIEEAIHTSYNSLNKISFDKQYYRKDIGQDLMKLVK